MTRFARRCLLWLLAPGSVLLSTACGPGAASAPQQVETRQSRFSADDRRAAQALSIGNQAALTGMATAYDRALLCNIALGSLTEQLQERGALSAEQQRALGEVGRLYERKLRQTANAKTADEIAADRARVEDTNPDLSTRAQIAIGCVRRLQKF